MTDDLSFDDVEAALFVALLYLGVREADAGMRLVLAAFRGWQRVAQ